MKNILWKGIQLRRYWGSDGLAKISIHKCMEKSLFKLFVFVFFTWELILVYQSHQQGWIDKSAIERDKVAEGEKKGISPRNNPPLGYHPWWIGSSHAHPREGVVKHIIAGSSGLWILSSHGHVLIDKSHSLVRRYLPHHLPRPANRKHPNISTLLGHPLFRVATYWQRAISTAAAAASNTTTIEDMVVQTTTGCAKIHYVTVSAVYHDGILLDPEPNKAT